MKVLPKRTFGWIIVLLCTAGFILTDQGRILSPDTEIVFRAGEHLAQNGDLSVPYDLEGWKGFGVAKGVDGKLYSVFGPLESVVLAPFIKIASAINGTGWYTSIPESLPLSYQVDDGLQKTFIHAQTQYPEPHALRLIVSLLYLSVSILGVYVFWLIACKILSNELAVFLCSLLYAFGTIVWNYSGTLFSEPLAILFVLLSLHTLISCDPSFAASSDNSSMWRQLVGGIFIGLAVAAHITAMIIVPFFVFYCFAISYSKKKSILFAARPLSMFIVGVGTVLLLLGYYNFIRF